MIFKSIICFERLFHQKLFRYMIEQRYLLNLYLHQDILSIKKINRSFMCILSRFSCVTLFDPMYSIVHQAALSKGFSRQEYSSGLPCPLPGILPMQGSKSISNICCIGRQVLYHQCHMGSPNRFFTTKNFIGSYLKVNHMWVPCV